MKVSKVVFRDSSHSKALAVCDIVLDDCLRLKDISLYCNEKGYYLVMPSKQDVYQDIKKINKDKDVKCPKTENKKYEEFFHPLSSDFYKELLSVVETGYERYKTTGKSYYKP